MKTTLMFLFVVIFGSGYFIYSAVTGSHSLVAYPANQTCALVQEFLNNYEPSDKAMFDFSKAAALTTGINLTYAEFKQYIDNYATLCPDYPLTEKKGNDSIKMLLLTGLIISIILLIYCLMSRGRRT